MKKAQIYIYPEQYEFLESIISINSKKHKKLSISELIRDAINLLKEQYLRNQEEDKELKYIQTHTCPSLKKVWDNEKDAEYDKL